MSSVLHQIYYKPQHLKHLFSFAMPYENTGLTIFFENDPISKIVMASDSEKISVCSWKLRDKMRRWHNLTQEVLNSEYDVMSLIVHSERHNMIAMSTQWHAGFLPAIDLLWSKLGYKRPYEARRSIYQNHYSAKTVIYQDYVSNFLIPAMNLITTDEELNCLMMKDSNYGRLAKENDLKSVKAKIGLDFYPMAPFVLERCPALYYEMKGYRITYVPSNL